MARIVPIPEVKFEKRQLEYDALPKQDPNARRNSHAKPMVTVLEDYLQIADINCTSSEGTVFEHYDKLLVTRDVERNLTSDPLLFRQHDAVTYFEERGLFLPSFALTCNILAALYENKSNARIEKVLKQYDNLTAEHSYHTQNTLIDGHRGRIIHYPNKNDYWIYTNPLFNINRACKEFQIDRGTTIETLMARALQNDKAKKIIQNLTGLEDPRILINIGDYFGQATMFWHTSYDTNTKATCIGSEHANNAAGFDINSNCDLELYAMARGVKIPGE